MSLFKKYKFLIDLIGVLGFGILGVIEFNKYLNGDGKRFHLVFFIVCVVWVLIKIVEIIRYFANKKEEKF